MPTVIYELCLYLHGELPLDVGLVPAALLRQGVHEAQVDAALGRLMPIASLCSKPFAAAASHTAGRRVIIDIIVVKFFALVAGRVGGAMEVVYKIERGGSILPSRRGL